LDNGRNNTVNSRYLFEKRWRAFLSIAIFFKKSQGQLSLKTKASSGGDVFSLNSFSSINLCVNARKLYGTFHWENASSVLVDRLA
jgi:hypothetical protein